jgi:hypothetical protein
VFALTEILGGSTWVILIDLEVVHFRNYLVNIRVVTL